MATPKEEFAVEYKGETPSGKGLIVFDGDKTISLPISQVNIIKESELDCMMLIEIPEWLAIKEGMV